ncbi:putative pyruvate dehydrogenase (acetyl-transferring) [Helianthus debilis subsp. tardiflorus]
MMDCKVCFGLRFEKGLGLCCFGVWFRFRFWGVSCGLVSAGINISNLRFGRMLVMSRVHLLLKIALVISMHQSRFERIAGVDVPTPYAANLERMAFPQVKDRAFCLLNLWVTSALRDGVTQTTTTTIPSIILPIAKLLIGLL